MRSYTRIVNTLRTLDLCRVRGCVGRHRDFRGRGARGGHLIGLVMKDGFQPVMVGTVLGLLTAVAPLCQQRIGQRSPPDDSSHDLTDLETRPAARRRGLPGSWKGLLPRSPRLPAASSHHGRGRGKAGCGGRLVGRTHQRTRTPRHPRRYRSPRLPRHRSTDRAKRLDDASRSEIVASVTA